MIKKNAPKKLTKTASTISPIVIDLIFTFSGVFYAHYCSNNTK